ncbi:PREDICTED: uncharacterized protein LOC107192764 [Dufourea novaeangliae]|uniref:uncharacterized protein LOC107192764 n=1 Tax=Dufourea novaeangliae TaxID=178035 RepID=UPI0007677B32|nr:PREDICTED: uncharacterized protein LOC107192764 [Dufourea novaeangliae]
MASGQRGRLQDLSNNQLKELLRDRDLAVSGGKAELIARLLQADPDCENSLPSSAGTVENAAPTSGPTVAPSGITWDSQICMQMMEMMRAEMRAMHCELEAQREQKREGQRERNLQRDREAQSTQFAESVNGALSMHPTIGIKTIADLLVEFAAGPEDDFGNWRQQLELLRDTYRLDDNSARIFMSLRLRGKAAKWFHSKPNHLRMRVADLLNELQRVFDNRPNKAALRKEFEKRSWHKDESFGEYYFDKVTLANKVTIDQEELVDFIIDGIPDVRLRGQARTHRFKKPEDLLDAYRNISFSEPTRNDRDRREVRKPWILRTTQTEEAPIRTREVPASARETPVRAREARCYNCSETGHTKRDCPRPQREWGSCFRCGSVEHRARNCTQDTATRSTHRPGTSTTVETSTRLIQPTSPGVPFLVPISFVMPGGNGENTKFVISAMIDSGSPVSLIKSNLLPAGLYSTNSRDEHSYQGLNYSPVKVLGVFERMVAVNDVSMEIKFFVVPDQTMPCAAILGRDYILSPLINITLGRRFKIEKASSVCPESEADNFVGQIMQIEYVKEPESIAETLNIDPEIDFETSLRIKRIFHDEMCAPRDLNFSLNDIELVITVKSDQPVCFRPRRLAFAEKEQLRKILDDLCEQKIIRPSNSPYASPIVLVRKKNGELRLCIDYRELNKITIKDNFPAPFIDDCLDQLRGRKYFSKLDLKNGFHHVKVSESCIKYTSFVTPLGQFEYLRMPFGLTNAPRVFQRYINSIFSDLV